jgi:peptidoglycan/LPS O-acetylase OafA/YrhL
MSDAPPIAIPGRKLQSLDGLRAIAIILVFFSHLKNQIPVWSIPSYYLRWYVGQGWIGVDLFFVLSGFLITGILIDSRNAQNYFSGFYARRVLRIFPLYYLVLIAVLAFNWILASLHAPSAHQVASLVPLREDRWTYFCFLTNWIALWKAQWDGNFGSMLAHFWSLAIEEQFYFFWPFILWIVRPRAIPWIAGGVALLSAVLRFAWAAHLGLNLLVPPAVVEIQIATICRLDGLFIGALCAYLIRDPKLMQRISRWLPSVAVLGIGSLFAAFSAMLLYPQRTSLLLYHRFPAFPHTLEDPPRLFVVFGGYSLLALGFGALVLLAAYTENKKTRMTKFLQSRILAPVGKYSYGIYVFHVPVLGLANIYVLSKVKFHDSIEAALFRLASIVVIGAITFFIAAFSYEFFEKKILRFKRHFEPRFNSPPQPMKARSATAE